MHSSRNPLHLCTCNNTIALDRDALSAACNARPVHFHTALCRAEIGALEAGLTARAQAHIGCTQESALFGELASELGGGASCFNIRETAGWSAEGAQAGPKIAALIAAATLPEPEPVAAVTLAAGNNLLIVGEAGVALGWAERLASRFDVSVLITQATPDSELPSERAYPVWSAAGSSEAPAIRGHLGAFQVSWQQQNPIDLDLCVRCNACIRACPEGAIGYDYQVDSARCTAHRACVAVCEVPAAIDFERRDTARSGSFDLVLDLGATPMLQGFTLPQGYVAPGRDPLDQALAVQALGDWVGEFDKPRYVALDPRICAHSRSRKHGCSNCIDVCSTRAITSAGDTVAVDPHLCQGCGACSSVCPSGAMAFQYPRSEDIGLRIKTLLSAHREAGGGTPTLLFHSLEAGRALIDKLARRGKGLPANVIPLETWSVDAVGLDLMLATIALGAARVAVLTAGSHDPGPLAGQARHAATILAGLGFAGERLRIIETSEPGDWRGLEDALWNWPVPAGVHRPASFRPVARKRETLDLALRHLLTVAPAPVAEIALGQGAPFGRVEVSDACTLCMSCVGVCPASALSAAADAYRLGFLEKNCVQCGLCEATCPESAISLQPRLSFAETVRRSVTLREAEVFNCQSCGKPMGARPVIEAMLAKLAGHSMFASDTARQRLSMCADCRVIDMMKTELKPEAGLKAWDLNE